MSDVSGIGVAGGAGSWREDREREEGQAKVARITAGHIAPEVQARLDA